jgi:hypothetical protein
MMLLIDDCFPIIYLFLNDLYKLYIIKVIITTATRQNLICS